MTTGASGKSTEPPHVVFCTPTYDRPHPAYLAALEASVPALDAAGIRHGTTFRVGSPYISHARSELLRRALDAKADVVVFIDHDLSWPAEDLVRLIQTPGDVVCGTYRFKQDPEEYMGTIFTDEAGFPIVRDDGCVKAEWVPAGFLKVTKEGVDRFMRAHPELMFGPRYAPYVDLFNHGAYENIWYGEDYAFSRRWNAMGEDLWIVPDLKLTHHSAAEAYPGDFADYLMRLPGGSKDPVRILSIVNG